MSFASAWMQLLAALRACAEPTRLRLLALAARGAFCVMDFTEILGQSQPRLSRHLRLLCEAGLLERVREGANVWFAAAAGRAGRAGARPAGAAAGRRPGAGGRPPPGGAGAGRAGARSPPRASAARARTGTRCARSTCRRRRSRRRCWRCCRRGGSAGCWISAPAPAGCWNCWRRASARGLGIDASRAMLALARARLARAGLAHCAVRLADMYRAAAAPMPRSTSWCCRWCCTTPRTRRPRWPRRRACCAPGGRLLVVDLAAHDRADLTRRLAHRWPGFSDDTHARRCWPAPACEPRRARRACPARCDVRHLAGARAGRRRTRTPRRTVLMEDAR